MDDKSYNLRVPKRWVRIAMIVGVTALIVAPLTAVAGHVFDDVPGSHTFHEDITWLESAGVTKGCNPPANTEYCPDDNVTRGQMAAFMERFAGYIGAKDGTPAQADNADTLDGKDSSAFLAAAEGPALTGDTIQFSVNDAVNGVTKIEEVSVSAPADGFLFVSANSVWTSGTETNVLVWAQLDNTTCNNSSSNIPLVGFAYAITTGTMDFASASFGAPAAVSQGNHTLTLCANPFDGNLTPTLRGAAIQALFTTDGNISVNSAGSLGGPLGGASN